MGLCGNFTLISSKLHSKSCDYLYKLKFVGYISLFYETWLSILLLYLVVHLVSLECFMQILHCFQYLQIRAQL